MSSEACDALHVLEHCGIRTFFDRRISCFPAPKETYLPWNVSTGKGLNPIIIKRRGKSWAVCKKTCACRPCSDHDKQD